MQIELSENAFNVIKQVFFQSTIQAQNAKAYAVVQDELTRAEEAAKKPPNN